MRFSFYSRLMGKDSRKVAKELGITVEQVRAIAKTNTCPPELEYKIVAWSQGLIRHDDFNCPDTGEWRVTMHGADRYDFGGKDD